MNRRNFLKFMAVTPAAGAASAALIKLPGVEPKIELLEPQKILVSSDDIIVFDRVIRYEYSRNEDLNYQIRMGTSDIYPMPGRLTQHLHIEVYMMDVDGQTIGPQSDTISVLKHIGNDTRKVAFDIPELRGRVFLLSSYTMTGEVDDFVKAELSCIEINSKGYVAQMSSSV